MTANQNCKLQRSLENSLCLEEQLWLLFTKAQTLHPSASFFSCMYRYEAGSMVPCMIKEPIRLCTCLCMAPSDQTVVL